MKQLFSKTVTKVIIGSILSATICSSIVYISINNKLISLEDEILDLKNKNLELANKELEDEEQVDKVEKEDKLVVEEAIIKDEPKKEDYSKKENVVSNPVKALEGVFSIMNKANEELEKVHSKITNSGTFSGLQGTFDILSNYGSQLIDQATKLDLSNVGGVETSDIITSIGYELQGLSDADNMADEALNIMGRMGEFIAYIDYNYNNSENN